MKLNSNWATKDLESLLDGHAITSEQKSFLFHILFQTGSISGFTNDPVWRGSALDAIRWADGLLYLHSKTGEPKSFHVKAALKTAQRLCESLSKAAQLSQANAWTLRIGAIPNHSQFSTADRIVVSPSEILCHLNEVIKHAWSSSTTASPEEIIQWSAEISTELKANGISSTTIIDRLTHKLKTSKTSLHDFPKILSQIFFPRPDPHLVLLGLSGLRSMSGLTSDSVQIASDGKLGYGEWGASGSRAAEFTRALCSIDTNIGNIKTLTIDHLVVRVRVDALDGESALDIAMRMMSELLDKYVCQHPTLRVNYFPVSAVQKAGEPKSFRVIDHRTRDIAEARPLTRSWPQRMGPTLRLQHLARNTDAPLTKTALCWVALEAAGIETTKIGIEALSKAIALQAFRQDLISSYRLLATNCRANSEESNRLRRWSHNEFRKAKQWLKYSTKVSDPWFHLSNSVLHFALAQKFKEMELLEKDRSKINSKMLDSLGVSSSANELQESKRWRVSNLDTWVLLLVESNDCEDKQLEAIRHLQGEVKASAGLSLSHIQEIARSNIGASDYLENSSSRAEEITRSMIAGRNINLHSGVDSVSGAASLDRISTTMLDTVLEIWSAWYQDSAIQPSPKSVIDDLEVRFNVCNKHLKDGGSLQEMDIANLTSPNWSPLFVY